MWLTLGRSLSTAAAKSTYDVVIVGGGLVGNAMACTIGSSEVLSNKRVLVIDPGEPQLPTTGAPYSNRVSAVSPPALALFKKLNIWEDLCNFRVKRVDRLEVLDSCSQSSIRFEQPNRTDEIAYIIENNAIVGFLAQRIKTDCPNVTLRTKTQVIECRPPGGWNDLASIVLNDGSTVSASLIIGADGVRSCVRSAIDAGYTTWEYAQKAVVANLTVDAAENNRVAWQRFTPNGPIALLPLTGTTSSVTWSTSYAEADSLLQMSAEQFVDLLNTKLQTSEHQNSLSNCVLALGGKALPEKTVGRLPTVLSVSGDTRAAFPLGFGHTHTYVARRFALIGDAAHRVHPLAGQGVNLGWSDVAILAKCLENCVLEGGDIGSLTYLSDYDSESQRHNLPVQLACDWLNRLYVTYNTPFIFLRSMGLEIIDRITPLKNLIVYRTSNL